MSHQQPHSELQSLVRGPHSDAKASINPITSYMEMASHPVLSDAVSGGPPCLLPAPNLRLQTELPSGRTTLPA